MTRLKLLSTTIATAMLLCLPPVQRLLDAGSTPAYDLRAAGAR